MRTLNGRSRGLAVFVFLVCAANGSPAQTESGAVAGRITDPSGAIVANADVELTSVERGVVTKTRTNNTGIYVLASVPPGNYTLTVSHKGFRQVDLTGLIVNVQSNIEQNFKLEVGSVSESVTVDGSGVMINANDASVSTVVDDTLVQNLPLNGRSFNTLLQLTPGVVIAPGSSYANNQGQFSISGQRTSGNNFLVDGVSANFGVSPTFGLGTSGTGGSQAFSALGGTSSLVSVEALQEFRIETSSFAPEFGRSPGGQVLLTTKSGTAKFHGGIYEYFRNTALDANDWFANQAGLPRAAEHHNDFGGYLGGPLHKDKTFFFLSYEGALLHEPSTQVIQVPSEYARSIASSDIAPFLLAYPQPTDKSVIPGVYTGGFTGSYSNPSTLNAGSVRIDHVINSKLSIFGRYNEAPSNGETRANSLSELETTTVNTRTITLGATITPSSRAVNTLRVNYSRQQSNTATSLDAYGGAVAPSLNTLGPQLSSPNLALFQFLTYDTSYYTTGPDATNRNSQINIVDDQNITFGSHSLKFGMDFRTLNLNVNPYSSTFEYIVDSVADLITTKSALLYTEATRPTNILSLATSIYAQDTWRISAPLTITYGIRWELSPAPAGRGSTIFTAWQNVDNPPAIALAPSGTKLWNTVYTNFAPRIGLAFKPLKSGRVVIRGGFGTFYDLGTDSVGSLASTFPNDQSSCCASVILPLTDIRPYEPAISTNPPYTLAQGFAPALKLPRSYQWNLAVETQISAKDVISLTYAAQAGRQMLRQTSIPQPNANFSGPFALTQNDALSNYDSLQVQYRRSLSRGLQGLVNYTWSHSLDDASNDITEAVSDAIISQANDYASSSFDTRHSFSGALHYEIPSSTRNRPLEIVTSNWSTDLVAVVRSGFPFNASVLTTTIGGAYPRPDFVAGQPEWIPNPTAAGRRSLNPLAFTTPAAGLQGTEPRNDIPGFGLAQVDLSFERKFPIERRLAVRFRTDAFNVLNHPNFTNPPAYVGLGPAYLQSMRMLNQGLGGLSPLFQEGGPRSLQISLKVDF